MATFFESFPRIQYNIQGEKYTNFQTVANVLFRIGVLREIAENTSSYIEYVVADDETPEIVADKVYNDPTAYWLILYVNQIIDPQYDWPLNYDAFNKYVINKYGSLATAKTTYHHYEKVITRENGLDISEKRYVINQTRLANTAFQVPYDYYEGAGSLPEEQSVISYDLEDGKTMVEIIKRNAVTNYDYEFDLNEKRRNIKVIKSQFYPQIIGELQLLTKQSTTPYYRRLV